MIDPNCTMPPPPNEAPFSSTMPPPAREDSDLIDEDPPVEAPFRTGLLLIAEGVGIIADALFRAYLENPDVLRQIVEYAKVTRTPAPPSSPAP